MPSRGTEDRGTDDTASFTKQNKTKQSKLLIILLLPFSHWAAPTWLWWPHRLVVHHAPPSRGLSRQEYWSGFRRSSQPRGQTCVSCIWWADSLPLSHQGSLLFIIYPSWNHFLKKTSVKLHLLGNNTLKKKNTYNWHQGHIDSIKFQLIFIFLYSIFSDIHRR